MLLCEAARQRDAPPVESGPELVFDRQVLLSEAARQRDAPRVESGQKFVLRLQRWGAVTRWRAGKAWRR